MSHLPQVLKTHGAQNAPFWVLNCHFLLNLDLKKSLKRGGIGAESENSNFALQAFLAPYSPGSQGVNLT